MPRTQAHRCPCLLAAAGVLTILALPSSARSQGEVGDQLFKLLANDGGPDAVLGWSVGASSGRAIAGAPGHGAAYLFDTANGAQLLALRGSGGFGFSAGLSGATAIVGAPFDRDSRGASYTFDAVTGQQLAELAAGDADLNDHLGFAVAVSEGIAVVGAPDAGDIEGAAYLFNATTGQQIAKLLPNDLDGPHSFGISVAIDGGFAMVSTDGAGVLGAAYVYDSATGTELRKLEPSDGVAGDLFGRAVAISGVFAIVGAPRQNANGASAGAAYVFDVVTGQQINKLMPDVGVNSDNFGYSVALHGAIALIGTDGSDGTGSAYLFDIFTGQEIAQLEGDGGSAGDSFGVQVAIDGGIAVVGDFRDGDRGRDAGAAYLFRAADVDSDGDGLLDSWEINGIPYVDHNGDDQRYIIDTDGDGLSDADPNHKDLFVEMDVMNGPTFPQDAKLDVEFAFATAPVANPDGVEGIDLFLIIDDEDLPFEAVTQSTSGNFPADAGTTKTNHFGTAAERARDDATQYLAAKAKAFRYCLGFFKSSRSIGGHAEIGGDDMIIYIGGMDTEEKGAVFMHELGHCLNLRHGGADNINGKPNYLSIMNYTLSYRENWNKSFWTLDYSRKRLAVIDEGSISELVSVGLGGGGLYDDYFMPFYGIVPDGAPCHDPVIWGEPLISFADLDPGELSDLNLDCDTDDFGFAGDLNFLNGSNLPGSQQPSPGEVLEGHDDWSNIVLPVSDGGGLFAGLHPDDELTEEQRQFMRDNFPPPPRTCLADWNADGEVNTLDVLGFLNAWAAGDSDADVNGDGYVNTLDVLEFLNAWAAGC